MSKNNQKVAVSFVVILLLTAGLLTTGCQKASTASNTSISNSSSQVTTEPQLSDDIIYIKTHSEIDYPDADKTIVISSKDELDKLLNGLPRSYDGQGNPQEPFFEAFDADGKTINNGLDGKNNTAAITDCFNESFFESHSLLYAPYTAASGSDEMRVSHIAKNGDAYIVDFEKTNKDQMIGTTDIAYWAALIPIEK